MALKVMELQTQDSKFQKDQQMPVAMEQWLIQVYLAKEKWTVI